MSNLPDIASAKTKKLGIITGIAHLRVYVTLVFSFLVTVLCAWDQEQVHRAQNQYRKVP